jgi:DNA-binding FrmR family transcriptional regulator
MFNFTKKTMKSNSVVGKHFKLQEEDKAKTITALNKIIGQLETIKKDISTDNACDDTLTQILSIRGGVASVGRNLVGKGILDCLDKYTKSELELVIKNMFKLD